MLFQKSILEDLMSQISAQYGMEAWKGICHAIEQRELGGSCVSEYEIYFNYTFLRTNQGRIRPLKWKNILKEEEIYQAREEGYDYVSWHHRYWATQ
jgi:hypothetical protein